MNELTPASLGLTSDSFSNGQPIPVRHTCDGANEAPSLNWSEPPSGTTSFALVLDDPDVPGATFRHWGVYNIEVSARSIGKGQTHGREAMNDFGKPGYLGPCPPRSHGPHHYHFKLFALNVDHLNLGNAPSVAQVERSAQQHAIARGELVGTYERK